MANSLPFIGQAKVGSTRLGWPTDTTEPPAIVRANGGCWGIVQDPGIVAAAQAAAEAKADAITKADEARDAAIAAAGLVAQSKADTAESNATATAATDAQTKADTAKADAIAAAKIASDLAADGAKSGAIAAAEADATRKADAAREAAKTAAALDATAKANQAKADATTAAANDATAKANTAQSEAIAAAALDATAKAGQAKTDAVAEATTMTNGIGKNLSSTSAPSASNKAPNGSIWRRTDSSGRIIGSWEQTGTGIAGTWTPRLISSEAIDNLDVGKLSASSGVINDLVAQTFAAKTASFQTVDVANLFATTATLSEAVISKLFADVVTAGMVTAGEFIGENAILTGSITAPKITASEELSAKLGEFLRVNTRMLEADAIDGMVITGAIFQSPGDGAGFQLTENGYTSRDADGNVTVRIPTDGSTAQFRGDLEAKSLTASGRVSFQAPENEIASGAAMVLESGVQAPASPPTVGDSYEVTHFPAPPERASISGIAYAAGLWWRGVNVFGNVTGDRVEGISDSGEVKVTLPLTQDVQNGVTAIGDEVFVLAKRHDRPDSERYVSVFKATPTSLTYLRQWRYTAYGTGTYQPGIGTDGTNVLIAQCEMGGNLNWYRWDKVTGAVLEEVKTYYPLKSDVAGIYQGVADYGAPRVTVSKKGGTTASEQFKVDGTHISWGGWYAANGAVAVGLAWLDGHFWQLTSKSALVQYSSVINPSGVGVGDASDWWMTQTWVGPGGEETGAGTPQRFTFMRRSELQVSGGEIPPGVVGAKFYLARKAANPKRADFHLIISTDGAKARLRELPTNWATLPTPPASNTFPNADSGTLKSRIGGFEVKGDGSGSWGPLTFNADGTMSSSEVPGWVPITTFSGTFGPAGFGYPPAYRVWPSGLVEWRGVVESPATTSDVSLFPAPAGTVPSQSVNLVGAADTQADITVRVEFGSVAYPNQVRKYPQRGKPNVWTSLDGMSYYLD